MILGYARSLINKAVSSMLRYGASKKVEVLKNPKNVQFIDWQNPANNNFAIAEEVTI
jgi:type I restriction enzyme, R subunit